MPVTPIIPGEREEGNGETPTGSGYPSETTPSGRGAARGYPSRDAVDFEELDRLFALMPEGPWHPLRTGDSHEIRQIDTDPTNKHHWPFRLCQSIAGQRAACDDAVFAFIAGVLNAWPTISAANSDDAFIERTLAMPEDELRKRFLIDGKCPEQAADIAQQSFRIAELKVALMQISSQYVENRGDMTDAEALKSIKTIADRALGTEARSAETGTGSVEDEGPACKATPSLPLPNPPKGQEETPCPMTVEEAREFLDGFDPSCGNLNEFAEFCRLEGSDLTRPIAYRRDCLSRASRIELALSTIRASEEDR